MAASKKKKAITKKAAVADIRPAASAASSTSSTVTVAYNHPRDLTFVVADKSGIKHRVTIKGNAAFLRGLPKGILPTGGQYGITTGIDADLWDAIVAKYGQMPAFKNGLIIATSSKKETEKEAEASSDVRNGFEPIDPARSNSKPATSEE